jgi:hypothetical protein
MPGLAQTKRARIIDSSCTLFLIWINVCTKQLLNGGQQSSRLAKGSIVLVFYGKVTWFFTPDSETKRTERTSFPTH